MKTKQIFSDDILQNDIVSLIEREKMLEALENTTVLVTGATGLIGSQLVKLMCALKIIKQLNIRIIACARSLNKAQNVFGDLIDEPFLRLIINDINMPLEIDESIDYIIHGASATSSKYFVSNPVETILTAINGTDNVLTLAAEKKLKGFVYLSSLEVYGVLPDKPSIKEKDYGYIEPLSTRSSYSEGKRMVECLCASYGEEYGVPVKIARLSQTFGAGVEYNDGRVFAEFARCAIEKRDIVLRTEGKTIRSYCYTADALSAIMTVLLKGNSGEAYNVTNMDTAISIKDMAQLVCDEFGDGKIKVKIEIPENVLSFGFNPEMIIRLDSTKLEALGWKPQASLVNMFESVIAGMKAGLQE